MDLRPVDFKIVSRCGDLTVVRIGTGWNDLGWRRHLARGGAGGAGKEDKDAETDEGSGPAG